MDYVVRPAGGRVGPFDVLGRADLWEKAVQGGALLDRNAPGEGGPDRHHEAAAPFGRSTAERGRFAGQRPPAQPGSPDDLPYSPESQNGGPPAAQNGPNAQDTPNIQTARNGQDAPNGQDAQNGQDAPNVQDEPASGRHRAAELTGDRPTNTGGRPTNGRRTRAGARHRRVDDPDDAPAATFGDVLAIGEFRTIYLAGVLSWIGDYAARAAVTALVLHATDSIVAAAAAFAITYAPWLLGGQVLVSLAERYPYRTVMVTCDLARMTLMALVAIPRLPLPVVLILLLGAAAFSPPFDAARSATLPTVLPGDRYVVAIALNSATVQPVQVAGYLAGSTLAAINPRTALLINAATFAISAVMIGFGVRHREPALARERRTHLLWETVDGFRLVFGTPALRVPVMLVLAGAAVAVLPEGLGAPWAEQVSQSHPGLMQGLIMAAVPFGSILGALAVSRMIRPAVRRRLLGMLAIATPIPLALAVFDLPPVPVAILAALTGFAFGGLLPVANGAFVSVLPGEYRARAFGVVSGGLQLVQGFAVLLTGLLAAQHIPIGVVVGFWSVCGVFLMLSLVHPWTRSVTARTRVPAAAPGTMEP